ncbi:MAG: hypothetical protein GY935_17115 [Gammaproteobacteria bacterium]|nr:hypothetical protein [Gammaproteobacteria bacterium]
MKQLTSVCFLVWVALLIQACSESPDSAEDQIRQFLKAGVEAAEERSLGQLGDLLHENYTDHRGYTKQQLGSLLRGYFFRHKNIHLFTRIRQIELLGDNRAIVRLHVAMAGSVISDVDALSALRAQVYSFELQLIMQDEWLLQHAVWGPASIGDLKQ